MTFAWREWLQFFSPHCVLLQVNNKKTNGIKIKTNHPLILELHLGLNEVITPDETFIPQPKKISAVRNKMYTHVRYFTPVCVDGCSSAVSLRSWKRQCFMATEGKSHVCISCCTNIVQCSAWKEARANRQAVVSRLLLHQHRVDQFIPQTQEKKRAFCSRPEKRFESEPSWGLREKESKPFDGDFLLFPAVTFGNVRTVRASKASSYSATNGISKGEVGRVGETAGEPMGRSSAPSRP